jgi:hypothetical protein
LKTTGSLLYKKSDKKLTVLKEEKLDAVLARLESPARKCIKQLAQVTSV